MWGTVLATRERRNYYRINYPLALEYQPVDMQTILASESPQQFNVSPYFTLQLHLAELETEFIQLNTKINETQPQLAAGLEILNRKIELIGKTLVRGDLEVDDAHIVDANLSESGMSFIASDAFEPKTLLALKIVFPSDSIGLLLYAEVVRCVASGERFEIAVNYLKMPERCRSVLARTIIRAQMRQRRLDYLDPEDEDLRH